MRAAVIVGFTIIGLSAAVTISAQELWKGAQYGMTKERVQALFPNVTEASGHRDRMRNGALGLLKINQVTVSQSPFEVTFYFLDGKLDEVTLVAMGQTNDYGAKLLYDHLHVDLVAKYGNPIGSDHSDTEGMVEDKADWTSGTTNIVALYLAVKGANEPVVSVTYQTRISDDNKNL
jgi:hypothetical protein